MSRSFLHRLLVMVSMLLAAAMWLSPALAQEGGFEDTFDDLQTGGWERSEGVTIEDGVMRIPPGNFAARLDGAWSDFSLSMRLQYSGPGMAMMQYSSQEGSHYGLLFLDDAIVLERVSQGTPAELAAAPGSSVTAGSTFDVTLTVRGGQHTLSIGGTQVIAANDPEPLPPGGLFFTADGERFLAVDSIRLSPLAAGEAPAQPQETAPQQQSQPTLSPTPPASRSDSLLASLVDIQASQIDMLTFVINLLLAAVASYVLSRVYIYWGMSLSNRRKFASTFMLITVTTTFVILIVRSSVALSLGLVGALSIVRFRAAIKEPEELAYLFFAVGLGIGFGDNQRLISIIALAVGIALIGLVRVFRKRDADISLHVVVTSRAPYKIDLDAVMQALKSHTAAIRLMRFDENGEMLEAAFLAEFRNMGQLKGARSALHGLSPQIEISFLDNKGVW